MRSRKCQDVDCGWSWVVMAATCVNMLIIGGLTYSYGVIQIILMNAFDGGLVKTTWILSISSSLLSLSGPFAGFLTILTNCRTTMMIGSFLTFIGFTASAFVTELGHLYATLALLAGLGVGLTFSPDLVVLGYYFDKHMSIATAITVTGGAVGMVAGPPLLNFIESVYGWRGMFLMMGGISANMIVCSFVCQPNTSEQMTKRTKAPLQPNDQNVKEPQRFSTQGQKVSRVEGLKSYVNAVSSRPMVALCGSMFLWNITIQIVMLHLPSLAVEHAISKTQSSLLFTAMGICNIVSRLLAGFTVNIGFVDIYSLYWVSFAALSVITIVFPFIPTTVISSMVFSGLFGLFMGGPYAVITAMTKDLAGLPKLATAFGVQMMICGIGNLVGPPIAGLLVETSGSYRWSFVFSGVICVFSSALGFVAMKCRKPEDICDIDVEPYFTEGVRPNSFLHTSQLSIPGVPSPYLGHRPIRSLLHSQSSIDTTLRV